MFFVPIALVYSCLLFYVFHRSFTIISRVVSNPDIYTSKWFLIWLGVLCIIISWIIAVTIRYWWENKFVTIMWTISSWFFILFVIVFVFLLLEHIISIWYKINPRIVFWVIVIVLWIWNYFSLVTKTVTLDISSDKIHKDMKVLLVSDVHTDYIFSTFHLKKVVKAIKDNNPDIVLIAWDLINRPHSNYIKPYSIFKEEKIETPIYAIAWNHDLMGDRSIIKKIPKISPVKLLENDSVIIDGIQIIWIDDKSKWWKKSLDEILAESKINMDDNNFTIFMTHQPISLKYIKDYPIDLEVAWHTHQWQFYWIRELVKYMNDYAYWKYEEEWKIAFVTQWIWTWWLPFRLWTQSEMVMINLHAKK